MAVQQPSRQRLVAPKGAGQAILSLQSGLAASATNEKEKAVPPPVPFTLEARVTRTSSESSSGQYRIRDAGNRWEAGQCSPRPSNDNTVHYQTATRAETKRTEKIQAVTCSSDVYSEGKWRRAPNWHSNIKGQSCAGGLEDDIGTNL